jgi:hypothetical protein
MQNPVGVERRPPEDELRQAWLQSLPEPQPERGTRRARRRKLRDDLVWLVRATTSQILLHAGLPGLAVHPWAAGALLILGAADAGTPYLTV